MGCLCSQNSDASLYQKEERSAPPMRYQMAPAKSGKPRKDYSLDPKFHAFCAMDAAGDIQDPKSMYLKTIDQLVGALNAVDIACKSDGREEFDIIDSEFRGHIRFKDFCKFVKNHKKGQAYEDQDSSASTSDLEDVAIKEMWRDMDPERNCYISYETMTKQISKMVGMDVDMDAGRAICQDLDKDNDGHITFKEFAKYCKTLLHS